MPLQNRVDPFGAVHAVAARGTFTGNRGVIHDPATKTLLRRRWTTKAWIVCACDYGDRRREPMGRNAPSGRAGWTELFFLDEPTALAAGHRPCFFCRHAAAARFSACFARGQGLENIAAPGMDAILHRQRRVSGGAPTLLAAAAIRALPDGAMVAFGERPFAVRNGRLLPWRFEGYGDAPSPCRALPAQAALLTPPATVAALRAGYRPDWHPSSGHNT